MTPTRKAVQAAVDAYFSGQITVEEAFERAYGPDPRKTPAAHAHPRESKLEQKPAVSPRERIKK